MREESRDRLERGIAAAKAGQRIAARAQLERVRESGETDPALPLWLAWVAESPDKAAECLRPLDEDPEFQGVARAARLWLQALTRGPESVRGVDFAAENTARLLPFGGWQVAGAPVEPLSPLEDPLPEYDRRQSSDGDDDDAPPPSELIPAAYHIACSHCGAKLEVGLTALGQNRDCPSCGKSFRVPRSGDGAVPVLPPEMGPPSAAANPQTTEASPPTVLLVDDSPSIRRGAEAILSQVGYTVLLAGSAQEAIDIVRRSVPQLVLLDIHLADASGYDVCRALRLFPALRTTPVVFLTGNDGVYDAERGRAAGGTDFLTKPCEPAALIAKVHVHLPSPVLSGTD